MKKVAIYLLSAILSTGAYAGGQMQPSAKVVAGVTTVPAEVESDNKSKYQNIIDEYKKYLSTVDKGVADEIKAFRAEVARLRQEKKDIYKKLSQEAQARLAKEREFKSKLPKKERAELDANATTSN